jgi:hypothetical protein
MYHGGMSRKDASITLTSEERQTLQAWAKPPTTQQRIAFRCRLVLKAADVKAVGEWCVVRRRRRTGQVLNDAVGNGTALSVAGRKRVLR